MIKKFDEDHWSWIVPLILLIGIITAIMTGCFPEGANAAQPSPSPRPADDGRGAGINALGIIGGGLFVGIMIMVAIRNMKKHSN